MKYLATLVLALFLAGPAHAGGDVGFDQAQDQVVLKVDVNSEVFPWAEAIALVSALLGLFGLGDHARRKKQGKPSLAQEIKDKLGK